MKRRSIAVAIVALFIFTGVASASWWSLHTSSCSGYLVVNSVCMKEDTNGGGDIILLIQGANTYIDNLGQAATPSGTTCNGGIFNNGSWNDCISYAAFNIASGYKVCAFENAYEGGSLLWKQPGPANSTHAMSGSANDNISSVILVNNGSGLC